MSWNFLDLLWLIFQTKNTSSFSLRQKIILALNLPFITNIFSNQATNISLKTLEMHLQEADPQFVLVSIEYLVTSRNKLNWYLFFFFFGQFHYFQIRIEVCVCVSVCVCERGGWWCVHVCVCVICLPLPLFLQSVMSAAPSYFDSKYTATRIISKIRVIIYW